MTVMVNDLDFGSAVGGPKRNRQASAGGAKAIFPYKYPKAKQEKLEEIPRFAVGIYRGNVRLKQFRRSFDQTTINETIKEAKRWIRRRRFIDRCAYLVAPGVLAPSVLMVAFAWLIYPLIGKGILAVCGAIPLIGLAVAPPRKAKEAIVFALGRLKWTLNDFCRGWLVTGQTGSGKTVCITVMLHSVFKRVDDWGGLGCDEKGIYWETFTKMGKRYKRERDLLLLQTRPDGAPPDWKPPAKFNLLSDIRIPASLYARVIVDCAIAMGGGKEDKAFFKQQAELHIGKGIDLFRLVGHPPSMHQLLEMLTQKPALAGMLKRLVPKVRAGDAASMEIFNHFRSNFLSQPPEQLGGVQSTIYNYLGFFSNADIAEVFGDSENTFDFSYLDDGAIICLSMPQKYKTERQYVTTILKLLFYSHLLRRFDPRRPDQCPLEEDNLLICWQDEAQRFITEADGNVDQIRQARGTTVMAAQSRLSFVPVLGREKTEVTTLNLSNLVVYRAADNTCAQMSSHALGEHEIWKKSYSFGRNGQSINKTKEWQPIWPRQKLMRLKKFNAVVKHPEFGSQKMTIHPVDAYGKTPSWYNWWQRLYWSL
jgi:TraM recognition site of TraD and TraG